ncbi:MAG: hypothetical protein DIU61_009630 [Bacteroidota bacterium]
MATLNKPLCATSYGNTGFGDCFLEPSKIVGAFQVPSNFQIREADIANLQEILVDKIHAPITSRVFPYHNFISITDNTEDVTINTTDYGAKIFIRDGFYDFTFRYLKGGVQAHQEFAKNEGSNKYFLFYDDNGVLYGYISGGVLKGIPVDLFKVLPWRFPTGAEAAQYLMRFIINPVYMNKGNLGFIKVKDALEFNLFDVVGLQDVVLTILDSADNVATVQVRSKISDVNLYSAYKTNLLQTTAWRAFKSDNTLSSITSVSDNSADEAFDVAVNYNDWAAEFDGDKMTIQLAIPSVLKAPPIEMEGFEDKDGVAFPVESASS